MSGREEYGTYFDSVRQNIRKPLTAKATINIDQLDFENVTRDEQQDQPLQSQAHTKPSSASSRVKVF